MAASKDFTSPFKRFLLATLLDLSDLLLEPNKRHFKGFVSINHGTIMDIIDFRGIMSYKTLSDIV